MHRLGVSAGDKSTHDRTQTKHKTHFLKPAVVFRAQLVYCEAMASAATTKKLNAASLAIQPAAMTVETCRCLGPTRPACPHETNKIVLSVHPSNRLLFVQ